MGGGGVSAVPTEYLELEDLLALARDLGVEAVRDAGLLASAAARPATVLYGAEAYPRLEDKAAVLLESVVRNHALVDGNKRLGWLSFVVFLGLNGAGLAVDDDDAYQHVIGVAEGRIDWRESACWTRDRLTGR